MGCTLCGCVRCLGCGPAEGTWWRGDEWKRSNQNNSREPETLGLAAFAMGSVGLTSSVSHGCAALLMAQTLCLGRELDFWVPFRSRIGQAGILSKRARWFKGVSNFVLLGTRFQTKFGLWLPAFLLAPNENSLSLAAIWFRQGSLLRGVSKYLPTERTESQTKSLRWICALPTQDPGEK